MIFRQLFEPVSCTYTYVLASRRGGEALIIDPVLERLDSYIELFDRLELRLVKAVDNGVRTVIVADPEVLGDDYDELLINLKLLATADLSLAIAGVGAA